jgi:phage tail protein X
MAVTGAIASQQGETLDAAAWRALAFGPADIGPLLVLNPGLADLGAVLPIGTSIIVPAATTPAPTIVDQIQLWD